MLRSAEMRNAIVQAISKRSQTKFAKLFNEFDAEKKKKPSSIILLLAELNEQKDFYVDFNIPLRYFLDLYEELSSSNKNFLFNEAGLLVHNATKIYERRLECVLQRVEDQLASLSNGLESQQQSSPTEDDSQVAKKTPAEKPTRKRKRLIESTQDPLDFQWKRRKLKKLAADKRFGPGTKIDRSQLKAKKLHVENYLHPALWKHAELVDLENEEDVDSKRNYRLFTTYVEHRYNTLVPDINFRLYYKMKDYLDADEGADEHINNSWPPLSQAFVKQYLKMEDRALACVQETAKRRRIESPRLQEKTTSMEVVPFDSGISLSCSLSQNDETFDVNSKTKSCDSVEPSNTDLASSKLQNNMETTAEGESVNAVVENGTNAVISDISSNGNVTINESNSQNLTDSGLGGSIANSDTLSSTLGEISSSTKLNSTQIEADKVIDETVNENMEVSNIDSGANEEITSTALLEATTATAQEQCNLQIEKANKETVELTVHIEGNVLNDHNKYMAQPSPSQNDEGVFFSDAEEAPLTPITVEVDKSVINSLDDKTVSTQDLNNLEQYHLSKHQTPVENWPIKINILEFPSEILKKLRRPKLLTHLGDDMEVYLKARCYKRTRAANESSVTTRKIKLLDRSPSSASFVYITPPPSPCDSVLLGFGEEGEPLLRPRCSDERLSRCSLDSGWNSENDVLTATPEKSSMFFAPILEDEREAEAAGVNETPAEPLNGDNVVRKLFDVEILENTLLQAGENSCEKPTENGDSNNATESSPETEKPANVTETTNDKSATLVDETEPGTTAVEIDNFMNVSSFNLSEPLDDAAATSANDDKHLDLCDDTVAKIQTWHRKLQPILAKSRDRHHFDVFEIGTNIISECEKKPDDAITFEDVMEKQDSSYVSRYFLSALLLANQGNIALEVNNKSEDRPTEWGDVKLKLLSTTRHVVAVEDNIGMLPTTKTKSTTPTKYAKSTSPTHTPHKTASPTQKSISRKLLPPPTPVHANGKKRKLSITTAAASAMKACNVNLNGIETIKPIGKTPRLSYSNDSGIASMESVSFDLSS